MGDALWLRKVVIFLPFFPDPSLQTIPGTGNSFFIVVLPMHWAQACIIWFLLVPPIGGHKSLRTSYLPPTVGRACRNKSWLVPDPSTTVPPPTSPTSSPWRVRRVQFSSAHFDQLCRRKMGGGPSYQGHFLVGPLQRSKRLSIQPWAFQMVRARVHLTSRERVPP